MESQDGLDFEMKIETEDETTLLMQPDPLERPDPEEESIKYYKQALNKTLVEKANDIHEKLIIAKSILEACQKETENEPIVLNSHIIKLQHYTKQPFWYLNEVIRDDNSSRTLKQVVKDTKPLPAKVIEYIYGDIRDIFIENYVKNKQMQTTMDFLKSLNDKRDNSFYKNVKICTLVKNNLVKYHHLPKLNRYILVENPEFAYQRHLYLRQIIRYRAQGKPIVYVTVKLQRTDKSHSYLAFAASSTDRLIVQSDSLSNRDEVKLWIRNNLLPKLFPNSVTVLMQNRRKDKIPTPFSTREEMLNWLVKKNIPCDPDSHKAQLYNLVKIYKKNHNEKGLYDEIWASAGLTVVACPIEYPSLDFFNDVYLYTTRNPSVNIIRFMLTLSRGLWTEMERKLIQEENQVMKDDEEMEKIIENMLQMAKNGDLKENDFPDGCCGTKSDNFAVHIGDIVVD